MSRRTRTGALAILAWLSMSFANASAACNKIDLLRASTNGPPFQRWRCGANVGLGGCIGCPEPYTEALAAVVQSAANLWAAENSNYTIVPLANVIWVRYPWPGNFVDVFCPAGMELSDFDAEGYTIGSQIYINNYNYGISFNLDPPYEGMYDFESILIHEMGHTLGLTNADCYSVMSNLYIGEVQRSPLDLDSEAIDLLYCCDSGGQVLANGALSQATSTCGDGNPAVETSKLRVGSGEVSWTVWYEHDAHEFLIEGLHVLDGPGVILARDGAGVGFHSVQLEEHDFPYIRLVEVERGGRRSMCDISSARPGTLVEVIYAQGREEEPLLAAPPLRESLPSGEQVVIYTHESLLTPVLSLADYWESLGYDVSVYWYPHFFSDEFELRDDIAMRAQSGVKYFHIVGGWADYFAAADLWDSTPYWRAKRDNYMMSGRLQSAQDTGASIPPMARPDDEMGPLNTARSRPYIFSDQGYADVDVDGTPDVVVTRWPVTTASQVETLVSKVTGYGIALAAGTRRPDRTTFFVGDIISPNADPEETVELASLIADKLLDTAPAHSTTTFLESDHLTNQVNDTAAHLNSWNPDLLVMLSTYSTCEQPGSFFPKDGSPAWSMGLLNSGTQAALVASGSCNSAEYTTPCGTFAQPVCNDFLFTPNKGALAWLGPTTGSWQLANYAVERFLVEEMFQNPYRPMAESWLVAMQRAYDAFGTSSDYALTLDSYVFLGDPLSPFARLPETDIDAFVNDKQHMMPSHVAVGCPQGDRDDLLVEVRLDATDVISLIPQDGLTLALSGASSVFFPQQASVPADSAPTLMPPGEGFANGYYRTTFTISAFSGCGIDSALVSLYEIPLGYAHLNVKSYDVSTGESSRGVVDLPDFAGFSGAYPSSQCNCVYQKDYASCVDYAMSDTTVNLVDFAQWWPHYGHEVPGGGSSPEATSEAAAGTVLIEFEEVHPLIGEHKLRAQVSFEGVEPFELAVFALHNASPKLEFLGWTEAGDLERETMCIEAVRDGRKEVVIGVLGKEGQPASATTLGTAEFRVLSDQQLVLGDEDLALVTADLLSTGSQRALAVSSMDVRRAVASVTYENALAQNYPNPFNPTTTISFSLAQSANANLSIYDVRGSLVRRLVDEQKDRGIHRVVWDGMNSGGQRVASGVYFYRLIAGAFTDTKKMTTLK